MNNKNSIGDGALNIHSSMNVHYGRRESVDMDVCVRGEAVCSVLLTVSGKRCGVLNISYIMRTA